MFVVVKTEKLKNGNYEPTAKKQWHFKKGGLVQVDQISQKKEKILNFLTL